MFVKLAKAASVRTLTIISFIACLVTLSCNKSSNLGSDLISDEWIKAEGVDTFAMASEPYFQDSLVYASAGFPTVFYAGKVTDPFFGTMQSEIYTQLYFGLTNETSFLRRPVDSVVFSLRYDSASFFGQPQAVHNIHIHALSDTLFLAQTYYKNALEHKYATEELGSSSNFIPNFNDSVKFNIKDATYAFAPQLRVNLDTAKFMGTIRSFPDSVFTSLSYFNKLFPGIAIRSDGTQSLLAFALSNTDSRITIYYNPTDTTKGTFEFNLGLMRISNNKIEPAGSRAGMFADRTNPSDSLVYISGFGGVDTRIKIPFHQEWSDQLVNYAVLELISPELIGDKTGDYKRCPLMNLKELVDGRPVSITDAQFGSSFNNVNDYKRYFGGAPVATVINGETVYKYRFNITAHFTKLKKEKKDLDLIVTPVSKTQSPLRTIFGGPKHSRYPAKLILVSSR